MKQNNLSLAIALVNCEPEKYYQPANCWQGVEKSLVCKQFAEFVDSWELETLQISGKKTESEHSLTYSMQANDTAFVFRRVGNSFQLFFNGHAQDIQQSTFDYWADSCSKLVEALDITRR